MAIEIRHAHTSELEEVSRVIAAAFEQYRPLASADAEARSAYAHYLAEVIDVGAQVGAELFVALEDGRVVGTATLFGPHLLPRYHGATPPRAWPAEWASLRRLAVAPSHRGRGIGWMLVQARVERARELGAPAIGLHTTRTFEAARAMYRRKGWRRAPEFDHRPLPDLLAEAYVRRLG